MGGGDHNKAKSQSSYTRTPSSERQFESYSEACSMKEGSSGDGGYICRYSGCHQTAGTSSSRDTDSRLTHHSSLRSSKVTTTRGSRESHVSEDSRSLRHSSTGSAEDMEGGGGGKGHGPGGGSGRMLCRSSTATSGKNSSVFSDDADSPKEWKTFRDTSKDGKKLRSVEMIHSNGAHMYRERGGGGGGGRDGGGGGKGGGRSSIRDPHQQAASLPRRTLRSITPDNESISFHDSIGREISKRRRARRRSASVSSRGYEETECERDRERGSSGGGGGGGSGGRQFSKRLDFAQSNQSIHAASSRNSSSKSEKSSSRSSRSPSVEPIKKGNMLFY